MNATDLTRLADLTRTYAEFQARRSGLATALGGLLAVSLLLTRIFFPNEWLRTPSLPATALLCAFPLLWFPLRSLLGRWLYGGLGQVAELPDPQAERRRARWLLGLAVFLLAFQTTALLGLARFLVASFAEATHPLGPNSAYAAFLKPFLAFSLLPLVYLLVAPLGIRGPEEARAYFVLVGQTLLFAAVDCWTRGLFAACDLPLPSDNTPVAMGFALAFLLLEGAVLVWAALAMVRGWGEHLAYLALLRALPRVEPEAN